MATHPIERHILEALLGSYPPRCTSSKRPPAEMVSGAANRAPAFEIRPIPERI